MSKLMVSGSVTRSGSSSAPASICSSILCSVTRIRCTAARTTPYSNMKPPCASGVCPSSSSSSSPTCTPVMSHALAGNTFSHGTPNARAFVTMSAEVAVPRKDNEMDIISCPFTKRTKSSCRSGCDRNDARSGVACTLKWNWLRDIDVICVHSRLSIRPAGRIQWSMVSTMLRRRMSSMSASVQVDPDSLRTWVDRDSYDAIARCAPTLTVSHTSASPSSMEMYGNFVTSSTVE
mmetsp:Transcript_11844/g.37618  ORF Transcript_11844/g.37618 Transcript_11844/m.37618 type:complete len:234 (+) Transcript_11844:742-1443(+)